MEGQVVDIGELKIVLRFVKKDYSRYTLFVPLFKFSKSFLRLEEKFRLYLKLKVKSKRYSVTKIANLVTNLVCCGVDRFTRMDDEFRIEKGLARSLGFPGGFPSAVTLYRFFAALNGYHIRQLERVNLELLKDQKPRWYPSKGLVFIDLDMNTKSVEGKQMEKAALGYNRKSPGRLCLNWTVGHLAKAAVFSQLHSGKASGKTVLREQVNHLEQLMTKLAINPQDPRIIWRVDGGYFSNKNLIFLNQRRFITRVPKSLKGVKPLLEENKGKRGRWYPYGRHSRYHDAGEVEFPDLELFFRLVIVKTYRKKKTLIYPLVTNLFDWRARSIVKTYRGRQIVENCFRDTNQAFYSSKLPSSSFHGNQAFLWFVCLAYNQFFFFQKFSQREKAREDDSQKNFSKLSQKTRRD